MKTGALLKSACVMGCICAEGDSEAEKNAADYAEALGLAFQIVDDVLDIIGTEESLGKPIGSDAEKGKTTYASLNGVEKAKQYASELTETALMKLDKFDDNGFMKELTVYLLKRNK